MDSIVPITSNSTLSSSDSVLRDSNAASTTIDHATSDDRITVVTVPDQQLATQRGTPPTQTRQAFASTHDTSNVHSAENSTNRSSLPKVSSQSEQPGSLPDTQQHQQFVTSTVDGKKDTADHEDEHHDDEKEKVDKEKEVIEKSTEERVQFLTVLLWCGAFMVYASLGFFLTALIYDTWQEEPCDYNVTVDDSTCTGKTVHRINGKGTLQYIYISIGSACGILGAGLLTGRVFGTKASKPVFKFYVIITTAIQAIMAFLATTSYKQPDSGLHPEGRMGAGYEYAKDTIQYSLIAVGFLIVHEILIRVVQRIRTKHHLALSAQRRLALVKAQPPAVVHHVQAQAIIEGVRAEHEAAEKAAKEQAAALRGQKGTLKRLATTASLAVGASGSSASSSARDLPPNSRPTASSDADDYHIQLLMKRLLADKDKLSSSQLNLLFSLIIFFYIVQIGGVSYAAIEGWDLRQGIEFCVVTVATIGFGDTAPRTTLGRALIFVYFPLGFSVMSYTISQVWTQLFTHAEQHVKNLTSFLALYLWKPCREHQRRAARRRLAERHSQIRLKKSQSVLAKEERKALAIRRASVRMSLSGGNNTDTNSTIQLAPILHSSPNNNDTAVAAPNASVADLALDDASLTATATSSSASPPIPAPGVSRPFFSHHDVSGSGDLDMLSAEEMAELNAEEAEICAAEDEELARLELEAQTLQDQIDGTKRANENATEVDAIISAHEESIRNTDRKLMLSIVLVLFILLVGAYVFYYYEDWTYFESVYFCFCCLTTIGYGDFYPTLPRTKVFVIYYVMVGLGALAYVLSLINEKINKRLEMVSHAQAAAAEAEAEEKRIREAAFRAPLERIQQVATLPSWNERFQAAVFEMQRLGEGIQVLHKSNQVPSDMLVSQFEALNATLANLSQTCNQRLIQSSESNANGDKADSDKTKSSKQKDSAAAGRENGTQPSKSQKGVMPLSSQQTPVTRFNRLDAEDDVDLSLYGITAPGRGTAIHKGNNRRNVDGKKTAKIVVPRQNGENKPPERMYSSIAPMVLMGASPMPSFL